ncbi:hypothetical protein IWZ01DRAFT_536373 [Phyllosticta capitalensis]
MVDDSTHRKTEKRFRPPDREIEKRLMTIKKFWGLRKHHEFSLLNLKKEALQNICYIAQRYDSGVGMALLNEQILLRLSKNRSAKPGGGVKNNDKKICFADTAKAHSKVKNAVARLEAPNVDQKSLQEAKLRQCRTGFLVPEDEQSDDEEEEEPDCEKGFHYLQAQSHGQGAEMDVAQLAAASTDTLRKRKASPDDGNQGAAKRPRLAVTFIATAKTKLLREHEREMFAITMDMERCSCSNMTPHELKDLDELDTYPSVQGALDIVKLLIQSGTHIQCTRHVTMLAYCLYISICNQDGTYRGEDAALWPIICETEGELSKYIELKNQGVEQKIKKMDGELVVCTEFDMECNNGDEKMRFVPGYYVVEQLD